MIKGNAVAQQVGQAIRQLREIEEMSLEDLSDVCGLTPTFLGQIENAQCRVSLAELVAIALALGCDVHNLVDDSSSDTMLEADLRFVGSNQRALRSRQN